MPDAPTPAETDPAAPVAQDHDPDGTTPVGEPHVEGAVARALEGLGERPVHEHPDVFDAVHDQLRSALREADPR